MQLFSRKNRKKKVKKSTALDYQKRLSFQVAALQNQGKRSYQEDSFAFVNATDVVEIIQNGMLAIVADGMGGMSNGRAISQTVVNYFMEHIQMLDKEKDIPSQLSDMVYEVNENVYQQFLGESGTTLVLLYFYQEKAYWVSVGDSSIYIMRRGGLSKLNCDHTYKNELYLQELKEPIIHKENIEQNKDKVRLTEFVGKDTIDKVDYNIRPLRLYEGDEFLICSDGISSYIDEDAIGMALSYPPTEACKQLDNLVAQQAHPKQDNYTGLVIALKK